ncbi:MAG: ABC transporter ATP-binding protein [Planctomycetaceae bacterium]
MVADQPVVQIENLTKKYGEFTALDSMTLQVRAGEILGLIGPNGAGKTTTIKILVGLQRPTSGRASIAGADCVTEAGKIKQLVGYMPDKFGSYENMRVSEYLDFFGAAFGIPRRTRIRRIDEVMETTNTAWMKDRYVDSLSHGMGQRVGIARTMLHDPKVLILDEPANGLDPQARIEMRELLLKLAGMGKTLLVTSHILPELARICNRAAIMTQGKLRAYGTVEEIGRQVSQRRLVEIQVPESQVAEVARQTQALVEADAQVEPLPGEGLVRLTTSLNEEGLAQLLRKLVQGGLPISQFREVQTDLEDAFMKFARDDAGKAAGKAKEASRG